MARGGVTFAEVEEVARYLQGLGRNPTVDAIRERLGTGSRTTLAEHLKRWKSMQADGEGHLPQPLLALVTGLWDGLQSLATQRIQESQSIAHEEVTILKSQLQVVQQAEIQRNQTLHHLQEQLDAEKRAKSGLETQLQTIEKAYDKLNASHQFALQQFDNAKQENQRLHQLASQIQANLEHYQQAVQQQQLEQNLAKEKQHAMYAQELAQQKMLLDNINIRFHESEKMLASVQSQLEQKQKSHEELINRYEIVVAKNQEIERAFMQLTAEADLQKKYAEKNECDLLAERNLHSQLQQRALILTEQLQRAQSDLQRAEDKIETLRQDKLFLAQEKAQIEGALKQLQKNKETA
jgi:hypothetical protein